MKLSIAAPLLGSASAFMAPQQPASGASTTALAMSGVERNANFAKLAGGYLFPEIGRRRNAYLEANPDMADRLISLGIGDTTREFASFSALLSICWSSAALQYFDLKRRIGEFIKSEA